MAKSYKLIDFSIRGNVVRIYLGDPECDDYWGDDWDDTPYEHNAGEVYPEYVKAHIDYAFPYNFIVSEPCDGHCNSPWSKSDMKKQMVPMFVVLPCNDDTYDYRYDYFDNVIQNAAALRVYMGDVLTEEFLVNGCIANGKACVDWTEHMISTLDVITRAKTWGIVEDDSSVE